MNTESNAAPALHHSGSSTISRRSSQRRPWVPVLSAAVLLSVGGGLRADEFTVTSGFWGPASTPNTLAWAIAQANASSAPDNVISIAEGLEILVDGAESTGVLDLTRITRSVRIEGHGATLVGNPTFVTSGGLEITKDAPTRFNPASDTLVMGSYSFLNIGVEGADNSAIHVVINNLHADGLNRFARVEQNARLDLTGSTITRSVNFTDSTGHTPGFLLQPGATLNVAGLQASRNFALTHDGFFTGFFYTEDATLNISDSVVENSITGGVILQGGGTVNVVSSIFRGSGGVSVIASSQGAGTANIVNSVIFLAGGSVFMNGLDGELLPNRIQSLNGSTVNLTASTVAADLLSLDKTPTEAANGIPLEAADGGVINLYSSVAMVAPDEDDFPGQIAYKTAGLTTSGTLTADAYSFVHTTPAQDTTALQSLFAQPALRTAGGLSLYAFSPDPLIRSLRPFPEGAYPLAGGTLIGVVPDADGANRLVNPIDGGFILTDAFGDPRTTDGKRNIGAVQVREICPTDEANDWYDLTIVSRAADCLVLNQFEPWSGAFEGDVNPVTMTHGMTGANIDYRDANLWGSWRHLTWRGKVLDAPGYPSLAVPGEDPWPAAIYGIDWSGAAITPGVRRDIIVETFALEDARLSLIDIDLKLRGAENRLTLENASLNLNGGSAAGNLTDAALTIDVPSTGVATNRSSLEGWQGQPGDAIHLNLRDGAELTLKSCGNTLPGRPNDDRCWWSDPNNQIVVGQDGLMRLSESYLIVSTESGGPVGRFEVRDGGRLVTRDSGTTLSVDRLQLLDGGMLDLGNGSVLTGPTEDGARLLEMRDAQVLAYETAQTEIRTVSLQGVNDVELATLADVRVANLEFQPGATLNVKSLRGNPDNNDFGRLSLWNKGLSTDPNVLMNGGNIFVEPGAMLGFGDPTYLVAPAEPREVTLLNGTDSPSVIRVPEGAWMHVYEGSSFRYALDEDFLPVMDVSGEFVISGAFIGVPTSGNAFDSFNKIEDSSTSGTGRIHVGHRNGGPGFAQLIVSSSELTSDVLEVEPDLILYRGGELRLTLNPSARTNHKLVTRGALVLGYPNIDFDEPRLYDEPFSFRDGQPRLEVNVDPNEDAYLPPGTKFVLVDYAPEHPPSGLGAFAGLEDGLIKKIGLNHYRLQYSDTEYGAANGGNSSVITLTAVNAPPLVGPDDVERPATAHVAKVLQSTLLANDSDPEGNPLIITAVGNAQPAGATVVLSGSFVVYTVLAADAGDGSFDYTVSDGPGGATATGLVTVHQVDPTGSGPNSARVVKTGVNYEITFIGVPGRTYRVQYATDLTPPVGWNDFSTPVILTAPVSGVITYTDLNPPDPVRVYRAVLNP